MQELNLKIKRQFNATGIEFTLPTQTVRIQDRRTPDSAPTVTPHRTTDGVLTDAPTSSQPDPATGALRPDAVRA